MTIFSAAEANASTKNTIESDAQTAISRCLEQINRAITEGKYEVSISLSSYSSTVKNEVLTKFRAAGYEVRDQGAVDQRDYGYVTISWLTPPEVTE